MIEDPGDVRRRLGKLIGPALGGSLYLLAMYAQERDLLRENELRRPLYAPRDWYVPGLED